MKNYLKVVEISYQIETLKNKLEKAEIELQSEQDARKRLENYLFTLKEQGINVPEDLLPKEDEE